MSLIISTQTEEVAGGRRATSCQPRRATAGLLLRPCSSQRPNPFPPTCATGTTGAPQKGLLFAPLSAPSPKRNTVVENHVSEPRRGPRRCL
jgi:hypothetical protein